MFGQSELNFGIVFRQFELKFQDCSRTSRTKFSEMFQVFLDSMESPLSQKSDIFIGHLMCRDILVNFTSYYRCPYRMRLARKVWLESKFIRYSRFESPVYVLWLKR